MKNASTLTACLLLMLLSPLCMLAQNEKYEEINVRNFDKKYKKACRNVFLYYDKDDFNNSVNCETHKIVLDNDAGKQNLICTFKRDKNGYYLRVFDKKNDIRMYDTCKVKLRGELVFDLIKERIGGEEMPGGGYRKDFLITREQLKLIQGQGLMVVRLIRVGQPGSVDYIVPAQQDHVTEFIIDCLTLVK